MGVYEKDGKAVFGEPEDEGKVLVCAKCGNPIRHRQIVAYEPGPNRWTHYEPKCEDTKPSRKVAERE